MPQIPPAAIETNRGVLTGWGADHNHGSRWVTVVRLLVPPFREHTFNDQNLLWSKFHIIPLVLMTATMVI
jgi:hypothetical protein